MSKTLYKQKMVRQNNRNGLRERFGYGSLDTGLSSNGGMLPSLEWIHTPDKASGITGAYYATPPQQPTGVLLTYSHEITLQNLAAPNNPNFLASCGGDSICPSNHSVSTFTNNPGDYRTETWRILDSEGNAIAHTNDSTSNVNYGDTIMLQSVLSGWTLETCGLSDCNNGNELYNVSTREEIRNPMHNVQRWKIQHPLTPSLIGPIYTGDDIKLVNLAGVTSYLNTCGGKTGCAVGQLYGVNTCKLGSADAEASTSTWRINTHTYTEINTEVEFVDVTVDECKAACLGDPECKSFSYNKQTNGCRKSYNVLKDLINMGGNRGEGSPLYDVCTGDCDGDVDCAGDLKCFERESSTSQVPGCLIGGAGDIGNYDYCYDSSIQFTPDYDKMTVGNNGGMPCSNYCSSGWNNEAVVGSTCVKAVNTTTEALAGCGTIIPSGGLTCYCKNPGTELVSDFDYYELEALPYTHTPNKALSSHNFKSFTGKTVDQCKDACNNLEMPTDATSCSGWDCTIEGQFCPKGLPGSTSYAYTCGYPETSELSNDHLTAGNLHWIARGDTRPSCKSFDYSKDSQACSLSLQAAGKDGVPALSTYTGNPHDYYEKHEGLVSCKNGNWVSTQRPSYTDINPNPQPSGVPNPQGLPTHKWWVGSKAPYYDFPECHIPYNQPCNYGSPLESEGLVGGECCFGASTCVADIHILGGDICEPHRNKWNYAHDRRGEDAAGCTLQPGSECDYGTTGCCKDYRAWGGENHRCEYTSRGADDKGSPTGQAFGEYYDICVKGSPLIPQGEDVKHSGDQAISNSDIRLKENVELIGKSPSNINIYKFNYIGDSTVYEGVIANELPWLSVKDANGYLTIDYNQIDVEFKKHIKL
jgi:hypothetical protein